MKINQSTNLITGNYFNKHESKNYLYRLLVKNYKSNLQTIVNKLSTKNCLEIGSGEGYILDYLSETQPDINIVGSDINFQVCYDGKKTRPFAKWCVMKGENLPFKTRSYELIIACEVLEHLMNPAVVLEEIQRVCSKYLVISIPNEPIWRILNLLRLKYVSDLGNTPGHLQHWSGKSIPKLIGQYFFVQYIEYSFPWIFVVAEKP